MVEPLPENPLPSDIPYEIWWEEDDSVPWEWPRNLRSSD